jgi:uncharacterized membrane protein
MSTESVGVGPAARPEARTFGGRFASESPTATGALGTLGRAADFTLQRRTAVGLGCFSVGLGLFQLLAPRTLARLIGLAPAPAPWRSRFEATPAGRWLTPGADRWMRYARARWGGYTPRRFAPSLLDPDDARALVIRGLGARALVSGIGILTRPRPAAWLWSRVAGDMMDLSLLGLALTGRRTHRPRLIGATAAVLAVTALDVFASLEYTRMRRAGRSVETRRRRVPLEAAMLINRPPEECYRFWRDLTNLPRFMRSIESVRIESDTRSHWMAQAPGGIKLEWDSEIVHDTLNRLISWRSVDASVPHAGSVHFDPAPDGRGTLVWVRMNHGGDAGGPLSRAAARLLGRIPEIQIREDLRRFKRILETGECRYVWMPSGSGG